MQKTKILYIITKANCGGAQKYVFDLATKLDSKEFEISVVYGKPYGLLTKKLDDENIRTISIPQAQRDINLLKEIKVFFSLLKILNQEKPNIIHINSSKMGGLASLAGRIMRVKKIIWTAHGFAFNESRNIFQKIFIKFLTWLTIFFSHQTICITKKEAFQVSRWPLIKKKLRLIYNGIENIDFIEKQEARKILAKISENDLVVGTVAELHKNKGLGYAVLAMGKLVKEFGGGLPRRQAGRQAINLKYIIIGEGEERKNLEKLIKEKQLDNNIFLTGAIENASKYLKAFDIFLLPSIKEGLPLVLLEAGEAGLPVIATKVGGIPEIIEDMESGILSLPENVENLTDALKFVINNEEMRKDLGNKLKAKIRRSFSFEKMFDKVIELYKN